VRVGFGLLALLGRDEPPLRLGARDEDELGKDGMPKGDGDFLMRLGEGSPRGETERLRWTWAAAE
jgi:hypothetical protein